MIKIFSNNFKLIRIILFYIIILFPASLIYAADSSSTNFSIIESSLGAGSQMNSTNFSVSGSLSQTPIGSWTSGNLPLIAGTITSCGKITASGTYNLDINLTGISGSCFVVQADNVIINGAGHSVSAVSGNTNYAVVATSSGNGANGYIVNINNITFSNFTGGVNSSGSNSVSGAGGTGGSVTVASSTLGVITSNGGNGSTAGNGGSGGTISITNSVANSISSGGASGGVGGTVSIIGTNLDLSNNNYTAGTLNLSYSGTLTTAGTTLSALTHLIINAVDLGSYIGGSFPLIPGIINSCGTIYFGGVYSFGGSISGNCNILHSGATLSGAGYTLNGNVTANNYGITLSNINVTGNVSTTGASPGALVVNSVSNLMGTISVTGVLSGDGSSSLGNTTINSGASVATSSVNFVGDVINNGIINAGNAVSGKTTNNSVINTGSGSFVFNASSTSSGVVNGNAILTASSTNTGTVTGNLTFNFLTADAGVVTFSGSTIFGGTGYVGGNIYDATGGQITSWIFNSSTSNTGVLKGNATFNNTSSNSGTVIGHSVFNDTATNIGSITGNVDAYSPVSRPLGGSVSGQVVYHGYAGLYFNDSAFGHGAAGKWDDLNNWWTNAICTLHAPVIPTAGDDVIIVSGNIATTSISASVNTAVFQGTSSNGIILNASSSSTKSVVFNASSTNTGTIIGNATFSGSDTNNTGSVNGFITREYNAGIYTVVTDFTHNGFHWIVQAINGASVDLSGATYDFLTNTFQTLNNGIFTAWNSLIGGVSPGNPVLTITSPISGVNIKWSPNISWGTSNLCQYKIDGGNYISKNCASNGADIPRPSATATSSPHTMFFKSTDAHGNIAEKSVIFSYDNTQPVWTSCGSDLLDEATRPYYYLTSNVGDCTITASTTLRGDNNGGGSFFTAGSITGTGTSTNINLTNMTATGAISNFKNITVASSTLSGSIDVVGVFNSDSRSILGNTTVESGGIVYGGNFIGDVLNKTGGAIYNSTTTPVAVVGNTTNNGTIYGDFIFNTTSTNTGVINGNLTLNSSSTNAGTVNGDLKFNMYSTVNGTIAFGGTTSFAGTGHVTGQIKDYLGNLITRWIFNDQSSNIGFTIGSSFFNGTSTNASTVSGNAYFSGRSINAGTVTGNADIYYAGSNSGTISGRTTYHGYPNGVSFENTAGDNSWNNSVNWYTDTTLAIPLGRVPNTNEDSVLFTTTTLSSDITNNVFIASNNVLINGASHTITGNVSGNGAYGGGNAYNFNLSNITVTGTTSAVGGDGITSDGGVGGTINIDSASTGGVVVNGGDPLQNGGNAGTSTVTNSIAIVDGTKILAVGGASSGCGFGGNGGNISLIDSSGYILVTALGLDATSTCVVIPPPPTSRTGGYAKQAGIYISPAARAAAATAAANSARRPSSGSMDPSFLFPGLNTINIGKLNLANLPNLNFSGLSIGNIGVSDLVNPLANLLQLKPITGFVAIPKLDFSSNINNLLNSSLPKSLYDLMNAVPFIKREIASSDIKNGYDLYAMKESPINTPTLSELAKDKTKQPESIVFVSVAGVEKETKLSIDKKGNTYQMITVLPSATLDINVKNTDKVLPKTTFNGVDIKTSKDKQNIIKLSASMPKESGLYTLKIGSLTLNITVLSGNLNGGGFVTGKVVDSKVTPVVKPKQPISKVNLFNKLINWFVK